MKRLVLADVPTTVGLYKKLVLSNEDIEKLFGCKKTYAWRKRKEVEDVMEESKTRKVSPGSVPTKLAYEVWGIDIVEQLERYEELKELGIA